MRNFIGIDIGMGDQTAIELKRAGKRIIIRDSKDSDKKEYHGKLNEQAEKIFKEME